MATAARVRDGRRKSVILSTLGSVWAKGFFAAWCPLDQRARRDADMISAWEHFALSCRLLPARKDMLTSCGAANKPGQKRAIKAGQFWKLGNGG
jgi:hypothetical protein